MSESLSVGIAGATGWTGPALVRGVLERLHVRDGGQGECHGGDRRRCGRVIGSSGLTAGDFAEIDAAARARSVGVVASGNFSLTAAVDEVQYLDSDELGALITAIHRTSQLDLPVVLVGAGLPQLPGLAGDAKSYTSGPWPSSEKAQKSRTTMKVPARTTARAAH